jgi:hypothetical protein
MPAVRNHERMRPADAACVGRGALDHDRTTGARMNKKTRKVNQKHRKTRARRKRRARERRQASRRSE